MNDTLATTQSFAAEQESPARAGPVEAAPPAEAARSGRRLSGFIADVEQLYVWATKCNALAVFLSGQGLRGPL